MSDGETSASEPQAFTPSERRLTLAGLMLVFLLSALDQTAVSTAMPRIVSQLSGLNLYAWVTTAYLLSSTVMVPIYGKLSDLYGRKPILVASVILFTLGSVLCGAAGEFGSLPLLGGGMVQLIVFRAVQGVGGGGLFISAFTIIADMFTPRERSRFSALFGAVFGLASVIGPLIGGFFTQLGPVHIAGRVVEGWRWIFYVNFPVSLLALFMILVKMPPLNRRTPGRIDWIGAVLIVATFVPLLLALSWAGRDYAWGSFRIVGLLTFSAVGLLLFLAAEARASHPILSLKLFRIRTFWAGSLAYFIVSCAFMGVVTFLPLYMQLGLGASPTSSGVALLPLMFGLILASGGTGQIVTRTGRFKGLLVGGLIVMGLGTVLLVVAPPHASLGDVSWRVFILGLGLGPAQSLYSLAVQSSVSPQEIGVATSTTQFFRQVGSTIGAAVFGTILTNNLSAAARSLGGGRIFTLQALEKLAAARQGAGPAVKAAADGLDPLSAAVIDLAMKHVFLAGLIVLAPGLVTTLMMPAIKLRGRGPELERVLEDAAPAEGDRQVAAAASN